MKVKTKYFHPKVIYNDINEPRVNSVIKYMNNRVITTNKNFLCAVTGPTGSGKSWVCLKICEDYSNMYGIEFNPEFHIISSLKELLLLITSKDIDKKIRVGSIILFDEPQIETNSREWQSEANKAFNQLTSTFRNQRLIILFATPYLEFIDKQSRMLFHAEFEVQGYNINTKITTIKPRFLDWNKYRQQFMHKMLIVKYPMEGKNNLVRTKVNNWKLFVASKHITDVYERKKKEFTDKLNAKLLNNLLLKEKTIESKNKNEDFVKINELFNQYGEDYVKISSQMPHISPLTLEKYIQLIKRTLKREQ